MPLGCNTEGHSAPAPNIPPGGSRTHQPPGRHPPIRPTGPPGPPPAPPGPSGGPASWARCLATPRSPPRPRGGENRAAGRVPPLIVRGAKKAMDSTDTTDIFWATRGGTILVHPLGVTGAGSTDPGPFYLFCLAQPLCCLCLRR